MAIRETARRRPGTSRTTPPAGTSSAREASQPPEVRRGVVRGWKAAVSAWRGADPRGQRLEERREQVRRDFVTLDPRPW